MAPLARAAVGLLLLSAVFISQIAAIDLNINDPASIKSAASAVAQGLMSLYNPTVSGGVVGKFPYPPYYWWESGAAWGALINYWHYTGDDSHNSVVSAALSAQLSNTNDFMPQTEIFDLGNDDQAFWAFAAMSAAEYGFPNLPSPHPSWLTIVDNVFNDYVNRWNEGSDECNGGLKWQIYSQNNGYTYRNSISNGGFFQVAARLARMTGNQTYSDWAEKVWDWTNAVGLMDDTYAVYDGTEDTTNCTTINHLRWTYNVGVFMYGAAVMQNLTNGDQTWVTRTQGLVSAAGAFISPYSNATNILFEAQCETIQACDTDQLSMKGYLARWLAGTSQLAPFTAGDVAPILEASATAAAKSCTGGSDGTTCGFKWYVGGWDGTQGMGQQMVALEAMYTLLVNQTAAPQVGQKVGTSSSTIKSSTSTSTTIPSAIASTLASTSTTSSTSSSTTLITSTIAASSSSSTPSSTSSSSSSSPTSTNSYSWSALVDLLNLFESTQNKDSGS